MPRDARRGGRADVRAYASVCRKLFCAVILFGSNPIFAETDQRILEIMDQAMRSEEAAVSRDYSTKPVTVKLGPHRYVIPANYFGPKRRDAAGLS